MTLVIVGLSYRTAPIEQREKASLTDTAARAVMRRLAGEESVAEAVAISTCNRTEVYVRTDDVTVAEGVISQALVEATGISHGELECTRYAYRDQRAVTHLFRVIASLDAMVIGESEIQGQVREAFERAREEESVGPVIDQLFRHAIETGRRVRTETSIGAGSVSVASVAVDLAIAGSSDDLADRHALLIGAGEMGAATAAALVQAGVGRLTVCNRTVSTARALASQIGGAGIAFDELDMALADADIVISSTDAPHHILGHGEVERAMRARPGRPMVLIDIAVPRDLSPDISDVPGVVLHDIDDLERVVEVNRTERMREALRAEEIVVAEVERFQNWQTGLTVTPTIASLRTHAEEIRSSEIKRMNGWWESLSQDDRARVEQLTNSIVNKLLHEPTVRLRDAAVDGDAVDHVETLRHLFGLEAVPGK